MAEKKSKNQASYEIPVEGSLGLLALGDLGLLAWREKRDAVLKENTEANKEKDKEDEQ